MKSFSVNDIICHLIYKCQIISRSFLLFKEQFYVINVLHLHCISFQSNNQYLFQVFQNSPNYLLIQFIFLELFINYLQALTNLFDYPTQAKLYFVNCFKNKNTTLTSYFLCLFLIKFIDIFLSLSLSLFFCKVLLHIR